MMFLQDYKIFCTTAQIEMQFIYIYNYNSAIKDRPKVWNVKINWILLKTQWSIIDDDFDSLQITCNTILLFIYR